MNKAVMRKKGEEETRDIHKYTQVHKTRHEQGLEQEMGECISPDHLSLITCLSLHGVQIEPPLTLLLPVKDKVWLLSRLHEVLFHDVLLLMPVLADPAASSSQFFSFSFSHGSHVALGTCESGCCCCCSCISLSPSFFLPSMRVVLIVVVTCRSSLAACTTCFFPFLEGNSQAMSEWDLLPPKSLTACQKAKERKNKIRTLSLFFSFKNIRAATAGAALPPSPSSTKNQKKDHNNEN